MAPKATRAAKRAREVPSITTSPKKRCTTVEVDPNLAAVLEALQGADLPADVKSMLITLAPSCLGMPAAERQEQPVMCAAITMIGETINERCNALAQAVKDAENALVSIEGSRAAREVKVTEAEAAVAVGTSVIDQRTAELDGASRELEAAKVALEDAVKGVQLVESSIADAAELKKAIEIAMVDHFTPLKSGVSESSQAQTHVEVLSPLAVKINLDESLATALPSACTKKPDERGLFDHMVVEQLEAQLSGKLAELAELLANSESKKNEQAAVVEGAQTIYDNATRQHTEAAANVQAATNMQQEAYRTCEEAKQAVANFEPDLLRANEAIKECKVASEAFLNHNVARWEKLNQEKPAVVTEEVVLNSELPVAVVQN